MVERWVNILRTLIDNYLETEFIKMCSRTGREISSDGVDRFSWINYIGGIMEWRSIN